MKKDVLHYREVGCEELMPKKRTKMTGIDINIGNTPKELDTTQSLFSTSTFTEKPKINDEISDEISSNTSNTSLPSSLFSEETFKPIRKKPKKEKR